MSTGLRGLDVGIVRNEREILAGILDGLAVYNRDGGDPFWSRLAQRVTSERTRVPQAPITLQPYGDGAPPINQSIQLRYCNTPLFAYATGTAFTRLGLEDSTADVISATFRAAVAGDVERLIAEHIRAIFIPRTPGSSQDGYIASFFNGETDAPPYGQNANTGAINHYAGTNNATLSRAHIVEALEQMQRFGYGLGGDTWGLFNPDQMTDLLPLFDPTTGNQVASPEREAAIDMNVDGRSIAGVRIKLSAYVPSGYFAVIDLRNPPLLLREHIDPAYRGLRFDGIETPVMEDTLVGRQFFRRFGVSVGLLGAGAVRQIVASTTYTAPTLRF